MSPSRTALQGQRFLRSEPQSTWYKTVGGIRFGMGLLFRWCSAVQKPTLTIPINQAVSGLKKCRQCNGLSQSLPNCGQEFMIIGRLLEEGHRPGVQSTFLIVSRISGAEHDDWSCHKICQASHSFKDQEAVTCRQSEIEDDQVWRLFARHGYGGNGIRCADHPIAVGFQSGSQAQQKMLDRRR